MKTAAFLGVALALASCVASASEDSPRFIINQRSGDRTALPFSEGVQVGNTLYIAGHIGEDRSSSTGSCDRGKTCYECC